MEEKKKFELNDEMLNEVSGGADWNKPEYRVGETIMRYCVCGYGGRKGSPAVITEIIGERMKIKTNCCGREFVIAKRSGEQQHFI